MAIERTFSIIKPDATARNLTGAVNALIEKAGLRIVAQKRIRMTREQAETFYAVHKARPFFGELVEFMMLRTETLGHWHATVPDLLECNSSTALETFVNKCRDGTLAALRPNVASSS